MMNVKETLLLHDGFIDNSYLDSYCRLVERNTGYQKKYTLTNKHHIIPRSWFKLHNKDVDNGLSNLVTLTYRDHVLAHYYLCLCTEDEFQFANQLALILLTTTKNKLNIVDKQLVASLPMYNNIYESYQNRLRTGYKLYGEDK